jgi:hypothetical protein
MTDLGGVTPASSYGFLLQVPGGVSATLTGVQDGDGHAAPFSLSTTAISAIAGSVTTPSIILGGDTTTGFYRPAADQIGIAVAGVNVGTWSAGGLSTAKQITSTLAIGTPPLVVTSTTLVPNLYVARAVLADSATVNANLTGVITSVGNATLIASQTGTGTKFVVDTSPELVTPNIGAATGTSLSVSGGVTTPSIVSGSGGITIAPANAVLTLTGLQTISSGLSVGTASTTNGGIIVTNGASATVASSLNLDYSSGGRITATGADTSTNGTLTIHSNRSNGTNDITALTIATTGAVTAGVSLGSPTINATTNLFANTTTAVTTANGTASFLQSNGTDGRWGVNISRWSANAGGISVNMAKSRGASVGTFAAVQSGDVLGQVVFCGDDGTTVNSRAVVISATATGTIGASQVPGNLEIDVADSSGTLQNIFALTATTAKFANISTTASAANAFLDNAASNNLLRSTSSLRYKDVIAPIIAADALAIAERLEAFSYHSKAAADDPKRVFFGVGAEQAAEITDSLIQYDADGEPDGFMYDRLGVLHNPIIVDLCRRVAAMEARA